MTRRQGLWTAGLLASGAGAWVAFDRNGTLGLTVLLAGLAFVGAAVAALPARPRYSALCGAAAATWFLAEPWSGILWVHRPLMVAAALSFPDGRLRRRPSQVVVVLLAITAVIPAAARSPAVTLLLAAAVAGCAWWELEDAEPAWPGSARSRAGAAMALSFALAIPAAVRWTVPVDPSVGMNIMVAGSIEVVYSVLVAMCGGILLARLLFGVEQAEADSVISLSETDASLVMDRLRHRAETAPDRATRRVAAAATALLERNAGLQADLFSAVDDVRASRRRLVEASGFERRSLRRRLAERVLPRVPEVDALLARVDDAASAPLVRQCRDELLAIEADLDRLAQGLHPAGLSRDGLAALVDVAAVSPIPVRVQLPAGRLPPEIEAAVWYACTEAIANAAKHSGASSLGVDVAVHDSTLVGLVTDDGVGGARIEPEGGLGGLQDRLDALGGRLTVLSPTGRGTTVRIEVPLP